MEGSVKSLIEAEEEAHKIVNQAEKEKTEKVKDAHSMADQILNKKRAELEIRYREEEAKVSIVHTIATYPFVILLLFIVPNILRSIENTRTHSPKFTRQGSRSWHSRNQREIRKKQEGRHRLPHGQDNHNQFRSAQSR